MKKLGIIGGLLGAAALLGGTTQNVVIHTPESEATTTRVVAGRAAEVTPVKSTPQKPAARSVAQRQVTVRPMSVLDFQPRFVERPGRRRVKYGRARWVVIG